MALAFRFTPKEVDKMDTVLVEALLHLHKTRTQFESEELKRNARR
jgi:hypothetical protein